MKLKSLLYVGSMLIINLSLNAQNQQNTLPSSGNIGIGTTAPSTKLEINGNVKVDSCLIVKDTSFFERDVNMDEKLIVSGSAIIKEDVFVPNMTEASSNLFQEQYYKTVALDPQSGQLVFKSFGELPSINSIPETPGLNFCDPNATIANPVWKTGTNRLGTFCVVKVGIGELFPKSTLHVTGNSLLDGNLSVGYDQPLTNSASLQIKNYVYNDGALLIENDTDTLLLLENDGLLRSRAIRVDAESWADYVFDEDYELTPLTEVKTFIEENNHLPGVPSEKEVLENGLNVAETDAMLLKKLEEMTLYIIELEERLKKLENQQTDSTTTPTQDD